MAGFYWRSMKVAITSFYDSNVHIDIVRYQMDVFNKFRIVLNQIKSSETHYDNLNIFINDYDIYVFFDIDCIPLNADVIPYLISRASSDTLIGCAQRANHKNNNQHIYAGPYCLAFSSNLYNKIGRPNFAPTKRGDTAEELTYACEAHKIPIQLLWPTHVETPLWDLIDGKKFGPGTTYDKGIYHQFNSRLGDHLPFVAKCKEVLG
jgi:hypothetical protein